MRARSIVCAYVSLFRFIEQHNHTYDVRGEADVVLLREWQFIGEEVNARAQTHFCRAMRWDDARCAHLLESSLAHACRHQEDQEEDGADGLEPVPW